MTTIAAALQAVNARIAKAAQAAGRRTDEITLLAVSKTFSAQTIREAYMAGQIAFGESYVQEALPKIRALAELPTDLPIEWHVAPEHLQIDTQEGDVRPSAGVASRLAPGTLLRPLEWHFIGPIQSNKAKLIAENFAWVHSVDREKIAAALSRYRPAALPPLRVCLQVNVSGEATKSGVAAADVAALAAVVTRMPRLNLCGLMTIPAPTESLEQQSASFRKLRQLRDELNQTSGLKLETLSMGMSADLEAAIAEGATLVRVGTAIFGGRGL